MINNWKQFNENLFNYFNKDKKDERIKKNKEKFISNIDIAIQDFNIYLKLLIEHQNSKNFDYIENFIESFSNLAYTLDNYYNKFVKNNNDDNLEEYTTICRKVLRTASQIKKIKINISGWSIGYDPQQILKTAKNSLKIHEKRIENL